MRIIGVENEFAVITGADQVKRSKPDPEIIELILARTGISKDNAVMIGDAPTDIEIGRNAGLAASIGVCTGLTDRVTLLKMTEHVAQDISELKFALTSKSN